PARGLRFGMADERTQSGVRRVADEHVHVIGEHALSVDSNPAAMRGFEDDIDDGSHFRAPNGPLPTPRVPREMRVQADGFVRTACPHACGPWGGLTPGRRPG